MKKPLIVSVTGAAGNIGYALLFRIASGEMLGKAQPIILKLLEITPALDSLKGVEMELRDCAFPLLQDIVITDDPKIAFKDSDIALLVGARPRGKGMERKDLLEINKSIFEEQGKALDEVANREVKVLVVGNPANTNALIASKNAPNIDPTHFMAMTKLDQNRAISMLANKTGSKIDDIKKVIIWGNHSSTQFPDISHAEINGEKAFDFVDRDYYENEFIYSVAKRGSEIIKIRGLSSAASAANAIIMHMRDWMFGTDENDFSSMGVYSDGSYGIEKGIYFSFPVKCMNGKYEIVRDLELDEFALNKIKLSEKELIEEKRTVIMQKE